jgi:hypothetical protein
VPGGVAAVAAVDPRKEHSIFAQFAAQAAGVAFHDL